MLPYEHQEAHGHIEGDHGLAEVSQRGGEVSILRETQKLFAQNLRSTALGDSYELGRLTRCSLPTAL